MKSTGLLFPFTQTNDGGIIGYTNLYVDSIKSNLICFLTTKRGQRPMNNNLYSPIYDYVMEVWDNISEQTLRQEIEEKIVEYFPEIEIQKTIFVFNEETHLLSISLFYEISTLKIEDNISISIFIQP